MQDNWAHRSKGMRCRTCMWFVPKVAETPVNIGRCRRHAPTMNGWPVMFFTDWCGDHKLDENKVDENKVANGSVPRLAVHQSRLHKIFELAIGGLTIDGGHHKQYYLEQILSQVNSLLDLELPLDEWEKGIAP